MVQYEETPSLEDESTMLATESMRERDVQPRVLEHLKLSLTDTEVTEISRLQGLCQFTGGGDIMENKMD